MARYIDADELIDRVRYDCDLGAESTKFGVDAAVIMLINKQPQADVRPVVRGKWVEVDDYPHEEYECSVCGRIVEVTSANIKPEEEYPYCHCGAYMREVNEDEMRSN